MDRRAAAAVMLRTPRVAELARDNKSFLTRAVAFVAAQGVTQFLDIGAGLPTRPVSGRDTQPLWRPTHEAARSVAPEAMVAYVDSDPHPVRHSAAMLASGDPRLVAVRGDVTEPEAILADPRIRAAGLDPRRPACVVLGCVLHFLPPEQARATVARLTRALAPGSHMVISVGWDGETGSFAEDYNAQRGPRIYRQTRAGIDALFTGLAVVPPGVVDAASWQAGGASCPRAAMIMAGVGRILLYVTDPPASPASPLSRVIPDARRAPPPARGPVTADNRRRPAARWISMVDVHRLYPITPPPRS